MRQGYQYRGPMHDDQQSNTSGHLWNLMVNTFNDATAGAGQAKYWDERKLSVQERSYHLATKFSDQLEPDTAAFLLDRINREQNDELRELMLHLFARALTGEYRAEIFANGALRDRISDVTEKKRAETETVIATAQGQFKPNSKEDNAELLKVLSKRLQIGDVIEMFPEEDQRYLRRRVTQEYLDKKDTKEKGQEGVEERIRFTK